MQYCGTTVSRSASATTWALIDLAADLTHMHQAGCKGIDTVRCSRLDFKLPASKFKRSEGLPFRILAHDRRDPGRSHRPFRWFDLARRTTDRRGRFRRREGLCN